MDTPRDTVMPPDAARALLAMPGPGRVRYGAAMALWQAGQMNADELERFRVAAAHDRLILAQAPPPDAAAALSVVIDAADHYLAALAGPGLAEVRAGIATSRARPYLPPPQTHPVVAAHLAPALAALAPERPALAAAIAAAAAHLRWQSYDGYLRDVIGAGFADGHAFAPLIVAAPDHDFELGLFLIAPHLFYRDHHHPAPELYAPLTGPHGWRFGPGRPLVMRAAHRPVWNDPHRPHATLVGSVPFLCLYGWTRDIDHAAQVIVSDDWPQIESAPGNPARQPP